MRALLALSRLIDAVNGAVGRSVSWLILVVVLVSAGNALSRKFLHSSSNAWLELQWYLFAGIVLLGAPHVLNTNGHVRVDIFYGRLSARGKALVDLLGLALFLLPVACFVAWLSWPYFLDAFNSGEMSGNAGGLLRWPVKLLIPVGFVLLVLQGVAETIKRIAFLQGRISIDAAYEKPLQ